MSRLDSRNYNWFVLVVPPQKELAVEKIMVGEGFATFVPVKRQHKFANAAARGRGIRTEKALPIMPRYVFIGMAPDITPGWDRVFCYTGIFNRYKRRVANGVLGVDGRPCRVRHGPLRAFMLRHSAGEFNAPGYHVSEHVHRQFAPGDLVATEDELFAGRVVDIRGNRARVFIEIFGGGHEVSIPLEKLVSIQ